MQSDLTNELALLIALAAVIIGPTVQWLIARRQINASIISSNRVKSIEELQADIAKYIVLIKSLDPYEDKHHLKLTPQESRLFILLIKMAMLAGDALALCLVRAFLSAHEAKQLICLGYDPLSGDKSWGRRRIRHRERFLSLLYGQPIRCGDGE